MKSSVANRPRPPWGGLPRISPIRLPRPFNGYWLLTSIGVMAALTAPAVSASPRLRCQLDQGGMERVLEFSPVMDPYPVKAIDLGGRFRFKAVVIGDDTRIDYIKLYTYYQSGRQPVLMHEAKYLAPQARPSPDPDALTGVNYFYSPRLERELRYGCALIETTP